MSPKKHTRSTGLFGLFLVGLLLSVLAMTGQRVAAQSQPFTFESAVCPFEGLDLGLVSVTGEQQGFECGYVIVPLRHAQPDGPTIRLPVAIRQATSPNAQADPLFLAQGGPGGDAFGIYSLLAPTSPMAVDRDIVIFNQRGTQYADPELSCPETADILGDLLALPEEEGERLYNEALQACYDRLVAEGVDLSAFNSLENAADVDAIRQALGYESYNFYGVSYGTLLGLHLMRERPDGLRSVILDSVAPTDINFITEVARSENRVYDELFGACLADPACNEAYPNLEARYFALLDELDENPVTVTVQNPDTGETFEAEINGAALRSIMFQLFYLPNMSAVFPYLVSSFEDGDYRYLEQMWPLLLFDQSIAEGMYYSVMCAEDADFAPDALAGAVLRPAIAETAEEDLQSFLDACALWPVDLLPGSVDDPVVSDIPTLLLAGQFDPITTPAFANAAAASLTNAYTVVDPAASHGVAFLDPCVNDIMQAFLTDPGSAPDASCVAAKTPADVIPPSAITLPVVAGVNSLDEGIVAQAGAGFLLLLIVLSPLLVWPVVYFVQALMDKRPELSEEGKRVRLIGRALIVGFGILAIVFSAGLATAVVSSIVDQTLATGMVVSGAAGPVLWLPLLLLLLAIGIVILTVLLWRSSDAGSIWSKLYYTLLAISSVGLIFLLAEQGLVLPPL